MRALLQVANWVFDEISARMEWVAGARPTLGFSRELQLRFGDLGAIAPRPPAGAEGGSTDRKARFRIIENIIIENSRKIMKFHRR